MQSSASGKVEKFSSSKKQSRMAGGMKNDSRKRNKTTRGKDRYDFTDEQ